MNAENVLLYLKQAFTQNLGLKLLSFLFAFSFFGYIHLREDIQQRTIPVGVISLRSDSGTRELMTPLPPSIQLTLRGSHRAMSKLIQEGIAPVEIDLRDGHRTSITFTRGMFLIPRELEFISVDPPRLELEWEDIVTRQLPLQVSLTGQPAEGHLVHGEPEVEPQRVTVKGPLSRVEVLQFARLAPFDVTGLTAGRYPRRIAIESAPVQVRYLGSQAATVTVEIARRTSEITFRGRPVEVIGPPYASITPRTVDVTIIGLPEVIENIREEQIVPQADLVSAEKWSPESPHGSATVPVTVPLIGAQAEVQPPQITVRW